MEQLFVLLTWKLLNIFLFKKVDKLHVQLQFNDLLYFIFQNKCFKCDFFLINVFASELRLK